MSKQREELDAVLEALQNEMRETISKLDPNEMVWIHQPPNMRPILCKEPVVGAVPVCATASARKPLTDEQVDTIIASNVTITDPHLLGAVYMAIREVEAAHGIGEV